MVFVKKDTEDILDSIDCISIICADLPRETTLSFRMYNQTAHVIDKDERERTIEDYFRNKNKDELGFSVSLQDFSRELIFEMLSKNEQFDSVKIYSDLKCDGVTTNHMPMLDLLTRNRLPKSAIRGFLMHQAMKQPAAFLLYSGCDYHYIGKRLLVDAGDFMEFIGNSLLAGDIVDKRYLGHHLREGGGLSLRIASKLPSGIFHIPLVVDRW